MCTMLRSFLPVGQGAFYRESFLFSNGKINVVYDCGSSTNGFSIEEQIRNEFCQNEKIDAVFLSHLDDDHISGLPYLLEYCKVKNIFFPLVTTKEKIYMQLKCLLSHSKNDFTYRFISNPYDAFSSIGLNFDRPTIFQIASNYGDDQEFNGIDAEIIQSGTNVNAYIHSTNERIMSSWNYIPYNFRQEQRIKKLEEELRKQFNSCDILDNGDLEKLLLNNFSKNVNKIKAAYREVGRDLNINSMTLFSGICNHHIRQCELDNCCDRRCCYSNQYPGKENGCLYFGDYDASGSSKWKSIKDAYNQYCDYIGCIQVPHHGSKHNYNHELTKLNAHNIISAGYSNPYQHPHSKVLKDLILHNCLVSIVTEQRGSQKDFIIEF